jgi:hypothetical protein
LFLVDFMLALISFRVSWSAFLSASMSIICCIYIVEWRCNYAMYS